MVSLPHQSSAAGPLAANRATDDDARVETPETRYARTADGVYIAYQVFGRGARDFVLVSSSWVANVELLWEGDWTAALLGWFASRGRVVHFDRRGTGLSDGVSAETLPTLEARMEDIRTVMDAAGVERAVLYGVEDGAAQCFLFAASYPERTAGLVVSGASARGSWAPETPWAWTPDQWEEWFETIEAGFGSPSFSQKLAGWAIPSRARDAGFVRSFGRLVRHSLSPGAALAAERMQMETDVRHVLPLVQAPSLVIHMTGDQVEPVEESRFIAEQIPGATLAEFPGDEHHWWPAMPSAAATNARVDAFLDSLTAEEAEFDRVLATVLFTDIVGSTERAAAIGDRAWRDVVQRHHAVVRALLGRYRGHEVDTAGDGFFATFDGPARAIRCASAITRAIRPLDLQVRCGLHTGEVQTIDGKLGGIAVAIGARVGSRADASEVLVSQTVKDLVAGSGIKFTDAGAHPFKGLPGRWRLYRVDG